MPPKAKDKSKDRKPRPKRPTTKPAKLLDHVPGLETIAKPRAKKVKKKPAAEPTENADENQFDFQRIQQVNRIGLYGKLTNWFRESHNKHRRSSSILRLRHYG